MSYEKGGRIRGDKLQRIRAAHFRMYPLCARCEAMNLVTLATQLDHIVALANGGKDFDEDDGKNRQGLCDECHKEKTAEDLGWTYKPTVVIDEDGWPVRQTKGGG